MEQISVWFCAPEEILHSAQIIEQTRVMEGASTRTQRKTCTYFVSLYYMDRVAKSFYAIINIFFGGFCVNPRWNRNGKGKRKCHSVLTPKRIALQLHYTLPYFRCVLSRFKHFEFPVFGRLRSLARLLKRSLVSLLCVPEIDCIFMLLPCKQAQQTSK